MDLYFYDKDIEELACQINNQIDLQKNAIAEKRRYEYEIKQAISNIS
jgi:hypothetical protein